jgi:sulfate transport system ATP-binding protein
VINAGRVEQIGAPSDLYDHPANDFVMSFLGPVTTLGDRVVRPHDIEVFTTETSGTLPASVTRLQRIGFEVRAEFDAGASTPWVQLTRGQADGLGIRVGDRVWLQVADGASSVQAAPVAELSRGGV